MLEIGNKAPNFNLESTKGAIDLEIIKDKVLLIFYPRDNTPGCTRQLCAAQDVLAQYENLGVTVIAINYDSLDSHQRFAEKYAYNFPICRDEGKQVAKLYEAATSEGKIIRTVYIIDENKFIRYAKQGLPPTEELLEEIIAMQN